MTGSISTAFAIAWPEDAGSQPDKGVIRQAGDVVQAEVDAIRAVATAGSRWVDPVRVATTGAVSSIVAGATIDGKVVASGDRVARIAITTTEDNGIYDVQPSGPPVRSSDANSAPEMVGLSFFVKEGTVNGGKQFNQATPAPITLGTTPLAFREISDQTELNANLANKADEADLLAVSEKLDFDEQNYDFAVKDEDGNVGFGFAGKELFLPGGSIVDGASYNYDFAVVDANGNVSTGLLGGVWLSGSASVTDYSARDLENIERSNRKSSAPVTTVQRMTALYNTTVLYGQSLGRGQETWPALSRVNRFQNKMLGGNVLPSANDGTTYPTFGAASFNNLVAQSVDGSTQYNDAAEAALPPGDPAFGEPPNHGWVNFAKFLHNQETFVENDTARLFSTINASVSGRTIEQLSKVNTQDATDRYARFLDGLAKADTAAGANSHVVAGILLMQGEYNYFDNGGCWDKATYKALFAQLIEDMVADSIAATGQSLPPAFFTYQTGGSYTRDVDSAGVQGLHVGMAQIEVMLETPNVWMVGPTYPYTDKGGHLDSNGSRWFGNMVAKVWHHVVRRGRDWSPLRPVRVEKNEKVILIDFHVPVAPLVFDMPYRILAAETYASKGFKVTTAGGGAVAISSVEIVGQSIVKIICATDPGANGYVWYADKTVHDGNGMLRDSDDTVAFDNYVYLPANGMYAGANIPALVDKPYPLHNWSVAFCLPFNYSEI